MACLHLNVEPQINSVSNIYGHRLRGNLLLVHIGAVGGAHILDHQLSRLGFNEQRSMVSRENSRVKVPVGHRWLHFCAGGTAQFAHVWKVWHMDVFPYKGIIQRNQCHIELRLMPFGQQVAQLRPCVTWSPVGTPVAVPSVSSGLDRNCMRDHL